MKTTCAVDGYHEKYLQLLGEKTAVERMIAETPEEDAIDRASIIARLKNIEEALAQARPDEREPAGGRPRHEIYKK